jgi:hypothetical protein
MSIDLINAELLNDYSVSRLAEICYFNKTTSNKYIDYCADNCSFEFRFEKPIRKEFLVTLDSQDKEFFIDLILNSESAMKDVFEGLCDCDYELQEVA